RMEELLARLVLGIADRHAGRGRRAGDAVIVREVLPSNHRRWQHVPPAVVPPGRKGQVLARYAPEIAYGHAILGIEAGQPAEFADTRAAGDRNLDLLPGLTIRPGKGRVLLMHALASETHDQAETRGRAGNVVEPGEGASRRAGVGDDLPRGAVPRLGEVRGRPL